MLRELKELAFAEPTSAVVVLPNPDAECSAELRLRVDLECKRECHRQVEIRVRDRPRRLRSSVGKTTKAINQMELSERSGPWRAFLFVEGPPTRRSRKPCSRHDRRNDTRSDRSDAKGGP
jgi:hypothetical protein